VPQPTAPPRAPPPLKNADLIKIRQNMGHCMRKHKYIFIIDSNMKHFAARKPSTRRTLLPYAWQQLIILY
jgi:hypothetical protein